MHDPISQNEDIYSNDASSTKKSWFQISVKAVKLFGNKKRLHILQLPIPYCVSLIMVTITSSHIFINIFQTVHFSAVKFTVGNEKNIWAFFWYQNLRKFLKNSEAIGQAPLTKLNFFHGISNSPVSTKLKLVIIHNISRFQNWNNRLTIIDVNFFVVFFKIYRDRGRGLHRMWHQISRMMWQELAPSKSSIWFRKVLHDSKGTIKSPEYINSRKVFHILTLFNPGFIPRLDSITWVPNLISQEWVSWIRLLLETCYS